MSRKKQVVIVVGNVGREPDQRTTQKGTAMTTFSVATEAALPGTDGKAQTIWFDVVTTGKQAEFAAKYLHAGDLVMVEGALQPVRIYTKQDGTAGASLSLWAKPMGVDILQSKNPSPNGNSAAEAPVETSEEELPF